jgi:hypothetical protein
MSFSLKEEAEIVPTHLIFQWLRNNPLITDCIVLVLINEEWSGEGIHFLQDRLIRKHNLWGSIEVEKACHRLACLPLEADKAAILLKVPEDL